MLFSLYSTDHTLRGFFRLTNNTTPKITDATLAVCAFDIPRNDRGLIRISSTKNLAIPVISR